MFQSIGDKTGIPTEEACRKILLDMEFSKIVLHILPNIFVKFTKSKADNLKEFKQNQEKNEQRAS